MMWITIEDAPENNKRTNERMFSFCFYSPLAYDLYALAGIKFGLFPNY